jgi:hypothetical protein
MLGYFAQKMQKVSLMDVAFSILFKDGSHLFMSSLVMRALTGVSTNQIYMLNKL